jgi:hypothetical protein
MARRLNFFESKKQIDEMKPQDLIQKAFVLSSDPLNIWYEVKRNLSSDALNQIAQTEFDEVINA